MGTTVNYALPYPGLADPPNGAAQMQALAEKVDSTVLAITGGSGVATKARILTPGAAASALFPLTTTDAVIGGTSVSFSTANPNAQAIVTGIFDFEFTDTVSQATAHMIGNLSVDGSSQGTAAILRMNAQSRATVAQVWRVTLPTVGSHTMALLARHSGTGTFARAISLSTKWTSLVFDLP